MKVLILPFLFFVSILASAQNWAGYYTSNFTGVNAVDYQPADIAGTQYKFDVLVTGVKLSVFNRNLLFNSTRESNAVRLLLNNNASSLFTTGAVYLPSVMYSLNKRTAFAFSTTINAFGVSDKSSSNILNAFYSYQGGSRTYSGESSTAYINSWASFNLTGAYVILDNDRHRLKGGATAKLVQGSGSAYFAVDNVGYSVENNTINNLSADVQFQYNKQIQEISEGKQVPLFSKSIFAADLGVSYEYKNIASKEYDTPYLLKFSSSIRNLSSVIKYEKADDSFNYNVNVSEISVNEFAHIQTAQELMDTLKSISNISNTVSSSYKTKLPTYFTLLADYQVYKNCFINVNYNYMYLKAGSDANVVVDLHMINSTLRYDKKHWGVALPITYYSFATNLGLSLRWRYLVVGSSNVFNLLVKDESSQLSGNAYFVLKVPIYYKDKDKVKKKKANASTTIE